MSPLYLHDGKLLLVDGKLAANEACCCDGACCLPGICWTGLTGIFWLFDENGGLICPDGPPPPPPGYFLVESFCEPGNGRVSRFRKDLDPADCPIDVIAENEAADNHFIQVSNPDGSPGIFSGGGTDTGADVPPSCQDGLSQSACDELGGTFHSGQTCGGDPCSTESQCSESCPKTFTVNWSYKTDSGTITTTTPGNQFEFIGSADLNFVLVSVFCGDDGKWDFVVQFCAFFPNASDIWEARDASAEADGCPPDGDVGLACSALSQPCDDSSATGSIS
jgi:hypothetical protein